MIELKDVSVDLSRRGNALGDQTLAEPPRDGNLLRRGTPR